MSTSLLVRQLHKPINYCRHKISILSVGPLHRATCFPSLQHFEGESGYKSLLTNKRHEIT